MLQFKTFYSVHTKVLCSDLYLLFEVIPNTLEERTSVPLISHQSKCSNITRQTLGYVGSILLTGKVLQHSHTMKPLVNLVFIQNTILFLQLFRDMLISGTEETSCCNCKSFPICNS